MLDSELQQRRISAGLHILLPQSTVVLGELGGWRALTIPDPAQVREVA